MRKGLLFAVLFAAGCASEGELQYTSTLQAQTRGVVLSYDGLDSFAAMSDTTCRVDTTWGCPTADADLPTDEEWVIDHYDGLTLAASEAGVHTLDASQTWLAEVDLSIAKVRNAKLTDHGVLVVAGDTAGCALSSEEGSITLPGTLCAVNVSVAVDRAEGSLVVAAEDGVYQLNAAGFELLAATGDLVATGVDGRIYTANRGEPGVKALDRTGVVLWTVQTDAAVRDLEMRGDTGDLLVLVDDGPLGAIERRSGSDGSVAASYALPSSDGDLVVSGNGRTLGIVLPDAVHYYSLDLSGEEAVIDETPATDCLTDVNWSSPTFGD